MEPVVRVILDDSVAQNIGKGIGPEFFVTKFSAQALVSTAGTIFGIFMELRGNGFNFFSKKLSSLYVKGETLMQQDTDPELLNELLCKSNDSYSLLEKAILNHEKSSKGEFLTSNLGRLDSEKARFDKNTPE